MKKKAMIITAFYNYDYDIRIKYLQKYFDKNDIDYTIVTSDFDHRKKVEYSVKDNNVIQISVPRYNANLSFARMFSHFVFSKKMGEICNNSQPDIIYAITPPNFMYYFLKKYKSKNTKTYLVCELEDMWPESLPITIKMKKFLTPLLSVWASIRNKNINISDFIVFECELFRNNLTKIVKKPNKTVYLAKDDTYSECYNSVISDKISFVYLGSVNNLIDIDLIVKILAMSVKKYKTEFHIIGGGENIEQLVKKCENVGVYVINHGMVYDDDEKLKIFSVCHVALNIMKPTVCVGATMKSLEYFHFGMPVINSIHGDTMDIVDKYRCGLNVLSNLNEIQKFIDTVDSELLFEMHVRSRQVYEKMFSPNSFQKAIDDIIKLGL